MPVLHTSTIFFQNQDQDPQNWLPIWLFCTFDTNTVLLACCVLLFRQRFDASSTALQVLHGLDLSGQVALVTGASSGIGFHTARVSHFYSLSLPLSPSLPFTPPPDCQSGAYYFIFSISPSVPQSLPIPSPSCHPLPVSPSLPPVIYGSGSWKYVAKNR